MLHHTTRRPVTSKLDSVHENAANSAGLIPAHWPELLSVQQASAYLGLSRSAFYRARNGEGFPRPVRAPGVPVRYRRDDLSRWVRDLPTKRS